MLSSVQGITIADNASLLLIDAHPYQPGSEGLENDAQQLLSTFLARRSADRLYVLLPYACARRTNVCQVSIS